MNWKIRNADGSTFDVTSNQLIAMAKGGRLQPTDMVWREGFQDFVQAGRVHGLFPATPPPATEPVAVSTPQVVPTPAPAPAPTVASQLTGHLLGQYKEGVAKSQANAKRNYLVLGGAALLVVVSMIWMNTGSNREQSVALLAKAEQAANEHHYQEANDILNGLQLKLGVSNPDRTKADLLLKQCQTEIATPMLAEAKQLHEQGRHDEASAKLKAITEWELRESAVYKEARELKEAWDPQKIKREAKEAQEAAEAQKAKRKETIESQFSKWDGSHPGVEAAIKASMKDDRSYRHVKTIYTDMGNCLIVVTQFRGTNSFGAVVLNTAEATVSLDGKVSDLEIK